MLSKISTSLNSRNVNFFVFLFLLFFMVSVQSCTNSCAGFDCVNGECEDGTCACEDGWEGSSCNTSWANKFLGNYEGRDCYDSGIATYALGSGSGPDTVLFENQFKAYITNGTELVFPEQDGEQDGVAFIFSGTGTISNDDLKLFLTSKYPSFETACELTLTRKN